MAAAANAERLIRKETDRVERLLKEEDVRRAEEEDARPSASQSRPPVVSVQGGPSLKRADRGCASSWTGTRNRRSS